MDQKNHIKASLEDISSIRKKLLVEVAPSEVDRKINEAYRELGKQARIPGFRPGKVPRQILESRFWPQVEEDVSRNLMGDTLPEAMDQTKAFPLGPPAIERDALKKGQPFKYSALMEIRPQFDLGDYLGLEAEKEQPVVTEDRIREQLQRIREMHGKLNPVTEDRPLRNEDYAVVEYTGYAEDGKPMAGIEASNFLLKIGSGEFHPRFEEALIGARKGEERRFKVDFETNYRHSALAGKQVEFRVRVADIKELTIPELTDEFVRDLGAEFQKLDDLKDKVRESLLAQEQKRVDRDLRQRLLHLIADKLEFELPQVLVQGELDFAVENVRQNLLRAGSSIEKAGLSVEKLQQEFKPSAERRVKDMLVLGEIARKENISVEEEDLEAGFQGLAAGTGQEPAALRKYYEARNMLGALKDTILEEKTLNYLVEHAKIIEKAKEPGNKGDSK
jgi:trigger factor